MAITNNQYSKMAEQAAPKTNKIKNTILAFLIGGGICALGEVFRRLFGYWGLDEEHTKIAVPVTLIFLAAFLTAFHIFDKIARFAGAGTLVPITGFANAIVSPAMEFKQEGHVMGIGAKMFSIAGPVLVFGISASVVYGLILSIVQMI